MAFQTTTLPVLIASPGDTTRERKAVEEAILSWNSDRTRVAKVHLLPLRWELDATSELGRGTAQEVINRQFADEADIVIGIFYSRLGQPTADAPSGTADEVQRAIARGAVASVYFSSAPLDQNQLDIDQFQRLQSFRKTLQEQGLVGTFESAEDLKSQVRSFLERATRQLTSETQIDAESADTSPTPLAVLRCEYLSDREARTDRNGRITYRSGRERLQVSNLGSGPADHLRIEVEPVGSGESPLVLDARNGGPGLMVERLLDHTHIAFPLAVSFATAPQAKLTLTWEEAGVKFTEVQSIRWM
ncbi:hypothetical protein ABZX69_38300 [Streptomyces sp. NPDC004074]|uniref:hypothetical protein n=1 Tax=unclassified Streptomyces TaxID=2593676 RepID=UPI0033B6A316